MVTQIEDRKVQLYSVLERKLKIQRDLRCKSKNRAQNKNIIICKKQINALFRFLTLWAF